MLTGSQGLIENQINNWVRQYVCAVDKDHGRCRKLVLRHLNIEKRPQGDVHTVNISNDPAFQGTDIADKIILEVADAAQRDANDMQSGVQTYAIFAYFTESTSYVPRKVFRVAAEDDGERDSVGPSEPANEKGLVSQLMRHNEINNKNSMVGLGYVLQTFQKENREQREMIKHFMGQQIETSLLVQELLNDHSKRVLEQKQGEVALSALEGVFEHLKVGMPILVNRIAGKEIIPSKIDRGTYLLAAFLENLDPEQQQHLQQMLKPEQLAVLAELLGDYEEKKQKLTGKKDEDDGEDASEDEPAPKPHGKNGHSNGTKPKQKTLAGGSSLITKLFEKRLTLVKTEKATATDDARMERIERKAAALREKLRQVGQVGEDDKKEDS